MSDPTENDTAAPWFRGSGRISLRTLILIRWVAALGQLTAVLIVHYGLGFDLPLGPALAVIGVSVLLNGAAILQARTRLRLGDRDAALYIAYDLVQLSVLLSLTGGLLNPFSVLLLAPITVSATILSRHSTIVLALLTLGCMAALALWHYPLPGTVGEPPLPRTYAFGVWFALSLAAVFMASYAWRVAEEARRVGDALAASQMALAREQRVSALGALAAAAAHELGTPLGTITLVAKELSRELPADSPWADDVALLSSQAERCRAILTELAQRPATGGGDPYEIMPFSALIEAAAQPYRRPGVALEIRAEGADGATLNVRRRPELIHGLGHVLQNALQFAQRKVVVLGEWTDDRVTLTVADDGPGFPPALLNRLGEPYLSGRAPARATSGDAQDVHMGLGIFIATTLLGRSGASLSFANGRDSGATVVVRWPRPIFEA